MLWHLRVISGSHVVDVVDETVHTALEEAQVRPQISDILLVLHYVIQSLTFRQRIRNKEIEKVRK